MTSYGTHLRWAEIVDAKYMKCHVVDLAQAQTYRLVNNILNLLLRDDPSKDRAIRLWNRVGPGNGGSIARTKEALNILNIT